MRIPKMQALVDARHMSLRENYWAGDRLRPGEAEKIMRKTRRYMFRKIKAAVLSVGKSKPKRR